MKKLSFIFMALAILLSSCSLLKRSSQPNYNISFGGSTGTNPVNNALTINKTVKIANQQSPQIAEMKSTTNFLAEPSKENTVINSPENKKLTLTQKQTETVNSFIRDSKRNNSIETHEYAKSTKYIINKIAKKHKKENNNNESGTKSWIIALVLCFFLGFLGIHRFYLGYQGLGLLMLFTGGLFGVLWLIDLIRIAIGGLKPKNGDYK